MIWMTGMEIDESLNLPIYSWNVFVKFLLAFPRKVIIGVHRKEVAHYAIWPVIGYLLYVSLLFMIDKWSLHE